MHFPEGNEFKLSPIHTHTAHTGQPGVAANRSLVSDENSSILSSASASSTNEAKGVTLTPLHVKQLTTSDLFKSSPVHDKAKANAVAEGRLAITTTLSPLHAKDSGVLKQYASDSQSPERKPVAAGSGPLAIGLSPVHTKQSLSHGRQLKVTKDSSSTRKQGTIDNSLLLQLRDTEKDTKRKPDIPTESAIGIPEDNHSPTTKQSIEVQSPEDSPVVSPTKPLSEADKSGLGEDLTELQSALQAAGLPPMTMKGEETPKEEPVQSSQSSKEYYSVDISTKEAKIPQSSAPVDTKSEPLKSFTGDHSEPDKRASTVESGEPEHPGVMGLDLREAIRAIASEELTSISKEILKQQNYNLSQQPLPVNHETASASNDKKSERDTESLLTQGDGKALHATYEGLEKLSDLLADIEHDGENQEPMTNNEDSKKPGLSSVRKVTSTLPKASAKAFTSKQGPSSRVDTRLSSKVKAGIRTSSTSKSSYKTSSRLAELAAPKKVNKALSTTSVGSQAKPKSLTHTFRPSTSKSALPKQLSSGHTSLKQHNRTTAMKPTPTPTGSSGRQHQIVIPTGSSSALESQSDSEDEVIHAAHEGGRKTNNERPEIKMDAWKKALQEEKVCLFVLKRRKGIWPRAVSSPGPSQCIKVIGEPGARLA